MNDIIRGLPFHREPMADQIDTWQNFAIMSLKEMTNFSGCVRGVRLALHFWASGRNLVVAVRVLVEDYSIVRFERKIIRLYPTDCELTGMTGDDFINQSQFKSGRAPTIF
jgi:hypothetical protein